MQNTSKIPNIPNTLVKNFFIAGVNQKTLASKILDNKAYDIPPEVLFTMYQSKERVNNYLQFVFPEKVAVEYQSIEPKFYSFMTTDQEGFNAFIHVLIFYEEINEAEISSNDFDILTEILRKQHQNKKNNSSRLNGQSKERISNPRDGSSASGINIAINNNLNDMNATLFNQHRKKMQEMIKKRNDKTMQMNCVEISTLQEVVEVTKKTKIFNQIPKTPHNKVNDILMNCSNTEERQKEHKLKEIQKKEKMERVIQNIHIGVQGGGGAPPAGHLTSNMSGEQSDQRTFSNLISSQEMATPNMRSQIKGVEDSQISNKTKNINSALSQEILNLQKQQHSKNSMLHSRPKSNAFKAKDSSKIREVLNSESSTYQDLEKLNIDQQNEFKLLFETPKALDDYYGNLNSKPKQNMMAASNQTYYEDPYQYNQDKNESDYDDEFDDEFLEQNNLFLNRHTSNFGGNAQQRRQSGLMLSEQDDQLEKLYEKKRYVPVAICLETETEYHDVFRKILLALFDEIRVPDNVLNNKIYENRRLAFAELVAHIAFLKTIPAPPFNSNYNIYMFNKIFQIKEGTLDQLPNKNSYAVKILFDVLDVKSIFYCWKALLFDKTLIIFIIVNPSKLLVFTAVLCRGGIETADVSLNLVKYLYITRK